MKLITSRLPDKQRAAIHADLLANEHAYWAMRDDLVAKYPGKWVAILDGRVVVVEDELFTAMEAMTRVAGGRHPFLARVGREDEVAFRVRRSEYLYDTAYGPSAMPRVRAVFHNDDLSNTRTIEDAIPDTGADVSVLPEDDCQALGLDASPYAISNTRGVFGPSQQAILYMARVELDGRLVRSFIQPIPIGGERIIGRDVLNQFRVTFDGPNGRVIVEG